MKVPLILVVCLLQLGHAFADCDAPGMSFPKHDGTLHGFKVTKLLSDEEVNSANRAQHAVVPFGDYHFSFAHGSDPTRPRLVQADTEAISKQLSEHFVAGEFDRGAEAPTFSVYGLAAFDLNGDKEADVILFDVSPGANVYSGAVGIIDRRWVTLVEPTCY